MLKRIIAFFTVYRAAAQDKEIRKLKEALAASRFMAAKFQNQYLVLVDEHADLRAAHTRLKRARVHLQGLGAYFEDVEHGGTAEHPGRSIGGLARHPRGPHQSNRGT